MVINWLLRFTLRLYVWLLFRNHGKAISWSSISVEMEDKETLTWP